MALYSHSSLAVSPVLLTEEKHSHDQCLRGEESQGQGKREDGEKAEEKWREKRGERRGESQRRGRERGEGRRVKGANRVKRDER